MPEDSSTCTPSAKELLAPNIADIEHEYGITISRRLVNIGFRDSINLVEELKQAIQRRHNGDSPELLAVKTRRVIELVELAAEANRGTRVVPERPINLLRLVVIMHGIRDEGTWMAKLKRLIEAETSATVASMRIGRIALTNFLLAQRYLGYVQRYRDQTNTLLSNYSEADVIFIAHSYGTWCLGDVLKNWPYRERVMPVKVILCGTILPQNFPWTSISRHIFQRGRETDVPWIWNDIGGSDPFPLLARLVSKSYGAAGVSRFDDPTPGLVVNRLHYGLNHSGCFVKRDANGDEKLNEEFVRRFWLPIIRGDDAPLFGDDERTSRLVISLRYWITTAWEIKLLSGLLLTAGFVLYFTHWQAVGLGFIGMAFLSVLIWLMLGWRQRS